uniref:DNA-directed RNA polymerases I, II, and III subunit RPABC4 n=1 Tax=Ditylenchus dipsaci TaxID=166011 RepID=A0A915CUN7_9BILA
MGYQDPLVPDEEHDRGRRSRIKQANEKLRKAEKDKATQNQLQLEKERKAILSAKRKQAAASRWNKSAVKEDQRTKAVDKTRKKIPIRKSISVQVDHTSGVVKQLQQDKEALLNRLIEPKKRNPNQRQPIQSLGEKMVRCQHTTTTKFHRRKFEGPYLCTVYSQISQMNEQGEKGGGLSTTNYYSSGAYKGTPRAAPIPSPVGSTPKERNPVVGSIKVPIDHEPVMYCCADCNHDNDIRSKDPVRCGECGYRILYKKRGRRLLVYDAR